MKLLHLRICYFAIFLVPRVRFELTAKGLSILYSTTELSGNSIINRDFKAGAVCRNVSKVSSFPCSFHTDASVFLSYNGCHYNSRLSLLLIPTNNTTLSLMAARTQLYQRAAQHCYLEFLSNKLFFIRF